MKSRHQAVIIRRQHPVNMKYMKYMKASMMFDVLVG